MPKLIPEGKNYLHLFPRRPLDGLRGYSHGFLSHSEEEAKRFTLLKIPLEYDIVFTVGISYASCDHLIKPNGTIIEADFCI